MLHGKITKEMIKELYENQEPHQEDLERLISKYSKELRLNPNTSKEVRYFGGENVEIHHSTWWSEDYIVVTHRSLDEILSYQE